MRHLFIGLLFASSLLQAATLATFQLNELNGVYHPDQYFEAPANVGNPTYGSTALLAPNGVDQLPFQLLTNGNIGFRTRLPASTSGPGTSASITSTFTPSGGVIGTDGMGFVVCSGCAYSYTVNQAVTLSTSGACAALTGMSNGNTVFIKDYDQSIQKLRFSATVGGAALTLTGCDTNTFTQIQYTGLTAVGSTDIITAPNHNYLARDPIQFEGTLASGMTADTVYFVCGTVTTHTFKICTDVAGTSVVNIGDLSSGLNRVVTKWTFTLVSGTAPTGSQTNPVTLDFSNASYVTISNGSASLRVLKSFTPQSWSVGGTTLTSAVITGGGTITFNFPSPHGITTGDTITVNGDTSATNSNGPTGVFGPGLPYSITSTTSTTVVVATGRSDLWNATYNASTLTVYKSDLSRNPIQGIQLATGEWVGTGSHLYQCAPQNFTYGQDICGDNEPLKVPAALNTGYKLTFLEDGPLKKVIQATYTTARPKYIAQSPNVYPIGATAGTGQYTQIITFYANQKSFLVNTVSDMVYMAYLDLYANWPSSKPDIWRLRTQLNQQFRSNANPICGVYGPLAVTGTSGNTVTPITYTIPNHNFGLIGGPIKITVTGVAGNTNANVTAKEITVVDKDTVQLVDGAIVGNGASGTGTATANADTYFRNTDFTLPIEYTDTTAVASCDPNGTPPYRAPMASWTPSSTGGYIETVYNSGASSSAPVIAVYSGHPSTFSLSAEASNVGFHSSNADITTGTTALDLMVATYICNHACDGNTQAYTSSREIGIYVGTKADIAKANPQVIGAVEIEQNTVAGIDLTRLYTYQPAFSDPAGGFKNPYMDDTDLGTLRTNYRTDNPSGYAAAILASIGGSGGDIAANAILSVWNGNSAAAIDATIPTMTTYIQDFIYAMVYGDGIRDETFGYSQGTPQIARYTGEIGTFLADPNETSGQKGIHKGYIATLCSMIWDPDFYPPDPNNTGNTANQIVQFTATQTGCASTFPYQPFMALQLPTLNARNAASGTSAMNPTGGASQSSVHYSGTNDPTLGALLSMLKLLGIDPLSQIPQLTGYADWAIQWLTPPDPRFHGTRMCPSIGDGSIEPCGQIGQFATLFKTSNSTLAGQSLAAWNASSAALAYYPLGGFYQSYLVTIDQTVTPGTLSLTTKNFPGYMTIHRHNTSSANEHMVGIINGDFYGDHNHYDRGSIVAGFNNIPLIENMEQYTGREISGQYGHSGIAYDSDLIAAGMTWDQDNPERSLPAAQLGSSAQTEVLAFTKSSKSVQTYTRADGTVATRSLVLANGNAALPILGDTTSFIGTSAGAAKTQSYFLQYDGVTAVVAPWATALPATHGVQACDGAVTISNGDGAHALSSGLQHFLVTGAYFKNAYGSGATGQNADLYVTRGTSGAQVLLGDSQTKCMDGTQAAWYKTANTVSVTAATVNDGTHATVTVGSHNVIVGDTADLASVGGINCLTGNLTASAVTSTTITFVSSGCSGSYTSGGTVAPDYRNREAVLRINDTGTFTTLIAPYLKAATPSRTITTQSCGSQSVTTSPVSTTECISPTEYTWADGTAKLTTSYDTGSHAANGVTISSAPQEVYQPDSTHITWSACGLSGATASFTPPAGYWYSNLPVVWTGSAFTSYCPARTQPSTLTYSLTTTPVSNLRNPSIGYPNGSSASSMILYINSRPVGLMSCGASVCKIGTVYLAPGTYTLSFQGLDGSGVAIGGLGTQPLIVN